MKVYELLAEPERWTKGPAARSPSGRACHPQSPQACAWCLVGAVAKVFDVHQLRVDIYRRLRFKLGCDPANWNDAPERTHAEVVSLCRELDI